MQVDTDKLGTRFIKLARACDTEIGHEVSELAGADQSILHYYTEADGFMEKETLGLVQLRRVNTVSVVGATPSLNINSALIYVDDDEDYWIDAELYDTVFC